MIKQEIIQYWKDNSDYRGYPFIPNWKESREQFDKQDMKDSFARYVHSEKLPYPQNVMSKSCSINLLKNLYYTIIRIPKVC
jgi:hypothetical protein